jgi:hypothetical protein
VKHACAFSALVAATTSKSGKVSKAVEETYDDATDRLCGTQAMEPIHTAYKLGAAFDLIETGDGSALTRELTLEIVQDDTREVAERLIASAWLDLMAEDSRQRTGSNGADLATKAAWDAAHSALLLAKDDLQSAEGLEDEDDLNPHYGRYCDALAAFEATTPPDLGSLIVTMREAMNFNVFGNIGQHADDADSVEELRTCGYAGSMVLAQTWLHLLRLAGEHSPALAMSAEQFDGSAWIKAYQEVGGLAYRSNLLWGGKPTQPGLMLSFPHAPTDRSKALEKELLSPEKHCAVCASAPGLLEAAGLMEARSAIEATGREVNVITYPEAIRRGRNARKTQPSSQSAAA